MPANRRKFWVILFKSLIFIASYGFVAYRIYADDQLSNLLFNGTVHNESAWWLWLVFLLMPVNWFIESEKWRLLLKPTEKVRLLQAFGGVLAGLSIAIFTPNRTGEYAGRIWILRQRNRLAGISVTIAGSIAQSGVTFIIGIIAGWLWLTENADAVFTTPTQLGLAIFAVAAGFITYISLPKIALKINQLKTPKVITKINDGIKNLNRKLLLKALFVSGLRYAIFMTQFILLLFYFKTGISVYEAFLSIGMLYAAMLVIPTITIAEPGVRGSLSLLIFGVFSTNEAGILAASLTLWIINLAIPALIGALYLAALKIDKLW